jgi:ADP-ribose pyrophosphatase
MAAGPDPADGFTARGEELLQKGWMISLVKAHFSDPEGGIFDRDVVRHPGAVAVVPLHEDGSVTVVRQFRGAVDRAVVEIPAGTRDVAGEPAADTARRELAEEAGLAAERVTPLVTLFNSPGFCDQRTEVFVATGLRPCPPARDGVEERYLSVERLDPAAQEALLSGSEPVDATTAVALLLVRAREGGPER